MEVADRLIEYLQEEVLDTKDVGRIDAETPLLDGLLDSFALTRLIGFLEDQYDIVVEPEDINAQNFLTVARIERLVSKMSEAS